MKKNAVEYVDILTPKGTLVWPYLTEPNGKFEKEKYTTKFNFDLEADDTKKFISQCKRLMSQFEEKLGKKVKNPIPLFQTSEDDENIPEGMGQINTNVDASMTKKDGTVVNRRLPLFDASGRSIMNLHKTDDGTYVYSSADSGWSDPNKQKVLVGAGSLAILKVGVGIYRNTQLNTYGWSKKLRMAQILELVEHGQQGASFSSTGFEIHEEYASETARVTQEPLGGSDIDDF